MNSFIPWIGGKKRLRSRILAEFPDDYPDRYVEVFGGAGWILFSKQQHATLEVFNDLDGNLINLYRCIQYHCNELHREIQLGGEQIIPNLRELFFDYLAQLQSRGLTDIQRAARYFCLIRMSYGADRRTFGCSKKAIHNAIEYLPEIQLRLKDVVIENRDFEVIIKAYDKPNTLFYLDPPYFMAESHYEGFSSVDHIRLHSCLKNMKGRFVLSYNDHAEIRRLYAQFNLISVNRHNNLTAKCGANIHRYQELIIKNF